MQAITILRVFQPMEAQVARSRLEAAGFHPFVKGELSALSMEGYSLAVGGIQVQVPDTEADEARAFLNSSQPVDAASEPPPESTEESVP